MPQDPVDKDLEKAEIEASPERFRSGSPKLDAAGKEHVTETGERVERVASAASSVSSASSSAPSRALEEIGMQRAPTARDGQTDMERTETVMSRIQTQRSQHSGTVGATLRSRQSRKPLPAMGADKPYPPGLPEREAYVVEFDGADDPMHAQNWPTRKKVITAAMLAYTTFVAAFGSSIFSAAISEVSVHFGVSTEVGTLGVSFYVLGFATGPIFWAPFSELKGRRLPLVIGSGGFLIFQFAVAVSKDLQTALICRFWGGFFGACPLAVVAAVFSDMFDNKSRGLAVSLLSIEALKNCPR
jgi:DHA1 family multidrug resistance protein-like MFS transporter